MANKTNKIIIAGILFLCLITLVQASENFSAISQNSIVSTCSWSVFTDVIKVRNTGSTTSAYTITKEGSAVDFATITPSWFILGPGETQDVYSYFKFPIDAAGEYELQTNIKTDLGLEKALKQGVVSKKCPNLNILARETSKSACIGAAAVYEFDIYNAGSFVEAYHITIDEEEYAPFVSLSQNPAIVEPGSKTTVYLYLNLPDRFAGNNKVTATVTAEKNKMSSSLPFYLNLASCEQPQPPAVETATEEKVYNSGILEGVVVVNYGERYTKLTLKNTGTLDDVFEVSLRSGEEWMYSEPFTVGLKAGEEYEFVMITNATEEIEEGNYTAEFRIEGEASGDRIYDEVSFKLKKPSMLSKIVLLMTTLMLLLLLLLVIVILSAKRAKETKEEKFEPVVYKKVELKAEKKAKEKKEEKVVEKKNERKAVEKKKEEMSNGEKKKSRKKIVFALLIMLLLLAVMGLIWGGIYYYKAHPEVLNIFKGNETTGENATAEEEVGGEETPAIEEGYEAAEAGEKEWWFEKWFQTEEEAPPAGEEENETTEAEEEGWFEEGFQTQEETPAIEEKNETTEAGWFKKWFRSEEENKTAEETEEEQETPDSVAEEINKRLKQIEDANMTDSFRYQIWEQDMIHKIYLSEYFYDPDGTKLNYTGTEPANILVKIDGDVAYLAPKKGWYGIDHITFTANDGEFETKSDEVTLIVKPREKGFFNDVWWFIRVYLWYIITGLILLVLIILLLDYFSYKKNNQEDKKSKKSKKQ